MRRRVMKSIVTTVATITIAACAASDITDTGTSSAIRADLAGVGSSLVECPSSESATSSALITPLGGTITAGGATLVVPAGAVLEAANITVTVPASKYVEIEVSVEGVDHFVFEQPVAMTISYARCSRNNISFVPLTAWYIDSDTHQLLAPMVSIDNKLTRSVTFTTGHLSGYALAN